MILVGLNVVWMNCCGARDEHKYFFEANDYHEAATEVLRTGWSNPFQNQQVKDGEFHDTETKRTWSVDAGGHTKKDYRTETTDAFKERWEDA